MTPFELRDARSVDEAVQWLHRHGPQARPIAAGGDLLGLWKEGLVRPSLLVNLATVPGLSLIVRDDAGLHLGAMLTLARMRREPGLPPMLAEAIDRIASPQLRERTTLGGNLLQRPRCLYFRHPGIDCFKKGGRACPAVGGPAEAQPGALFPGRCHAGHPSDLAPVLIALDARVQVAGPRGRRLRRLADLYLDAADRPGAEAGLEVGELLTEVVIPQRTVAQAFEKVAPRAANEFSTACAAVVVEASGGRITAARIVLGGIAPAPWVCEDATARLVHRSIDGIDVRAVAAQLTSAAPRDGARRHRAAAASLAIERALGRALQGL